MLFHRSFRQADQTWWNSSALFLMVLRSRLELVDMHRWLLNSHVTNVVLAVLDHGSERHPSPWTPHSSTTADRKVHGKKLRGGRSFPQLVKFVHVHMTN